MISAENFLSCLEHSGVDYFAGVPDSLLKSLCACIEHRIAPGHHIISANEGSAVGLAVGYHLATGRVPAIYLQNSGQGNAINPLVFVAVPLILLSVSAVAIWIPARRAARLEPLVALRNE
jgi:phosphonopyruvate decarboxylase